MSNILFFRSAAALNSFIFENPTLTIGCVETEWGSEAVDSPNGPTLNHHQAAVAANGGEPLPVPCNYENYNYDCDIVAVSHMDLDTLGGILAIQGRKPEATEFWNAAAFVDVTGPHAVVGTIYEGQHVALASYWATAPRLPRLEEGVDMVDVTDIVEESVKILTSAISGHSAHVGQTFLANLAELDESSFVKMVGDVTLRSSNQFVNASYQRSLCVVGYNTNFKSITLSFAEDCAFSASDLLQEVFGPEAGGHAGIGGTPREIEYTLDDAEAFAAVVAARLAN